MVDHASHSCKIANHARNTLRNTVTHHLTNLGSIRHHATNFGAITRHVKTLCYPRPSLNTCRTLQIYLAFEQVSNFFFSDGGGELASICSVVRRSEPRGPSGEPVHMLKLSGGLSKQPIPISSLERNQGTIP